VGCGERVITVGGEGEQALRELRVPRAIVPAVHLPYTCRKGDNRISVGFEPLAARFKFQILRNQPFNLGLFVWG
jgi:hypothetical protein